MYYAIESQSPLDRGLYTDLLDETKDNGADF